MRLHVAALMYAIRKVELGTEVETFVFTGEVVGPGPAEFWIPPAHCLGVTLVGYASFHVCAQVA